MATRVFGFSAGVLAITGVFPPQPVVFLVGGVGVVAELAMFRSDRIRRVAQRLRRRLDHLDSFATPLEEAELSDVVARSPRSVKKRARTAKADGPYFASEKAPGPERALENLMESSWWSKHLAEAMRNLCFVTVLGAFVLAVVVLIAAIESLSDPTVLDAVARVVTGVLLLVASMGFFRLVVAYNDFAERAGRVEEAALQALNGGNPELMQAIRLLHEYHLARATSPILPEWIWRVKRGELNELWQALRRRP